MNYTTDTPQGSINPLTISGQWFDAKILNNTAKNLQRGNATLTGLVNGYKCEFVDISNGRLLNTTLDILAGVTDFSFVIGFKHALASQAYHMLVGIQNAGTPCSVLFYITLTAAGKLESYLSNSGGLTNSIRVTSLNNYDDDAWHVVVVNIDQTNKTLTMTTESETASGTNAAFVPNVMTADSSGDFYVGQSPLVPTLRWNPGYIGDFILFNSILSGADITNCLEWEKTRLGI